MPHIDDPGQEKTLEPITWDIRREGRAWTPEEFPVRADRLIEQKLDIWEGRLFWDEEMRHVVLGMLLENVGMDAAVRMGDRSRWREAIEHAERESAGG